MRRSLAPSQIFCGNKGKRNIGAVLSLLNTEETVPCTPSGEDQEHKETIYIPIPSCSSITLLPITKTVEAEHTLPNKTIIDSDCTSPHNLRYTVVWGKLSTKKHKTWNGDGTLEVTEKSLMLRGDDGGVLGTKYLNAPANIEIGQILTIGSKRVEVIEQMLIPNQQPTRKRVRVEEATVLNNNGISKMLKKRSFQSPFIGEQTVEGLNKVEQVVLPQPPNSHQWKYNEDKKPIFPVKVDAFLSIRLRNHQKDGVIFLYSCIMGFVSDNTGVILADEMGLGKTLQCITLIWTLLKRGPYGTPVLKRILIITPSTLCGTWQKEFLKWLGRERLLPYVVDNNNKPVGFRARPNLPVMIISYERFVKNAEDIYTIKFDLIVCDEAHRLKNANIKAAQALQNLKCKRRILLTGTPIQNDLQEYFVLIDIANPGILGTYNEFKEEFVNPILISQKPGCSEQEAVAGEHSAAHLQHLTLSFILRRTQALLKDYLPTKTECVICCNVTSLQETLYTLALDYWWSKREFGSAPSPLSLIVLLKKICNSPTLLRNKPTSLNDVDDILRTLQERLPLPSKSDYEYSGKLTLTKVLMKNVVFCKHEKLVIASCSTKMLDILADVCRQMFITFSRLDGSTPVSNRQSIVELFNSHTGPSVLLLSSRAGGTGLSLPAASHLVLFDSDWNPAVDNQAMARIWRDGQKKPVYIYRLLVTGSIEEKIYQRQMFKMGISDAVADPSNMKSTLKLCDAELKELFITNFTTCSRTHDILGCACAGDGTDSDKLEASGDGEEDRFACITSEVSSTAESSINQLKTWDHFRINASKDILQELNLDNLESIISFIFRKKFT